jgi:putative oxidoreductase
MKFLDGFGEQAYALLRIVAGLAFLAHGVQKFLNFPVAFPMPLNPLLYAAGTIELVAGGLIVIGLLTRPAAFIASGMAAAAYWIAHGSQNPFPIVNGGEAAVLYCFLFLFIATRGAGIWSVDGAKK